MASREAGFPHPVTPVHTHTYTHTSTHTLLLPQLHWPALRSAGAEQLGSRCCVSPLANFLQVLVPFCRKRRAHSAMASFTANTCLMQSTVPQLSHPKRTRETSQRLPTHCLLTDRLHGLLQAQNDPCTPLILPVAAKVHAVTSLTCD